MALTALVADSKLAMWLAYGTRLLHTGLEDDHMYFGIRLASSMMPTEEVVEL